MADVPSSARGVIAFAGLLACCACDVQSPPVVPKGANTLAAGVSPLRQPQPPKTPQTQASAAGVTSHRSATEDAAAIAAIVELRSQFGSIVSQTELDVPQGTPGTGTPDADFEAALSKVTSLARPDRFRAPIQALVKPRQDGAGQTCFEQELVESLRTAAAHLRRRADVHSTSESGSPSGRYLALAALLDAEAAAFETNSNPQEEAEISVAR